METIKDLWASLVAYANERSTNPLTSAFFLTWAAWNYKFFVVLFNDETSAEKFEALAELYPRTGTKCPLFNVLCPGPESWFSPPDAFWTGAFVYPALTTLFYVFAYPFITSWVVTFYRRQQVHIANKLKSVEGERVRTVDEVSQMVRRFEKRIKDAEQEANSAMQELADLRTALQAAEAEASKYKASSITSVGTGTVSDPLGAHTPPHPAHPQPSSPALHGFQRERVLSWVVQGTDGGTSRQSITEGQARILDLARKVETRSSSEIAKLLNFPLEDVNQDIRVLVQMGALERSQSVFRVTAWGKTILDIVNANGELDKLHPDALTAVYGHEDKSENFGTALELSKRTPTSDFKI